MKSVYPRRSNVVYLKRNMDNGLSTVLTANMAIVRLTLLSTFLGPLCCWNASLRTWSRPGPRSSSSTSQSSSARTIVPFGRSSLPGRSVRFHEDSKS